MRIYARKLSKDFKFVREGLYKLENEIRLGELTFIPMNSFFCVKIKVMIMLMLTIYLFNFT